MPGRWLWFKDTYTRGGRIQKMLFVKDKQPSNIDLATGERIKQGPPYYRTHMKEMPIDGVTYRFYFRERHNGGHLIYVRLPGNIWYKGKGFLFTDRLFTTKKGVEEYYEKISN